MMLGEKHLDYFVSNFLKYSHEKWPHQGKGNVPLAAAAADGPEHDLGAKDPNEPFRLRDIACRQRLGGLLKHYYRKAA